MNFATIGISEKDISRVMEEIESENDRAVAIVGAALIDSMLTDSILDYTRRDDETKQLFEEFGMFRDFQHKVKIGYLVGIFGPMAHHDLALVAKIRNKFAHMAGVNSFDQPPVIDWTRSLELPPYYAQQEMGWQARPWDVAERKQGISWNPIKDHKKLSISTPRGHYLATVQILLQGFAFVPDDKSFRVLA